MTTKTTMCAWTTRKKTSKARTAILCALALAATLSLSPPAAWPAGGAASTTKVPQLRTVEGMVSRKDGKPVQGAVVYLQDTKSLTVRSFLSDTDGKFHFRHLSMNLDYDLWAELNGKRSKTKSISQFNSKPDLQYRLKLPMS